MTIISDYIGDLRKEFKGYNGKALSKDLLAGLAVTAVALPLALAFGISSGASAAAGLTTAIVGGFLIGTFSGASFQVSGPTGAMVAILAAIAYEFGLQGVLVAGFLAGIMLIVAGFFKFGKVVEFIPSPVITGFTSGIAFFIAFGEVDGIFGVTTTGENVIVQVFNIIKGFFSGAMNPNFYAVAIACLVVAIMLCWPKKLDSKVPSSLVAIVVALIINLIWQLPVAVIGEIPKTLLLDDRLSLASLSNFSMLKSLLIPAVSIAALAMIESLLCGVSGGRMKGEKLNADRELIAQGFGNIVLPFLGGIPATAAIARSSMAIKSGGRTRLTTIFHCLGLLLSMMLLSDLMSQIPMAALSGVLVVVACKMNDWSSIKYIFGKKIPSAMAAFAATLLTTVVIDLAMAIVIGLILSCFMFIMRIANIEINIVEINYDKLQEKGISSKSQSKKSKVVYLSGPIFFAAIDKLNQKLAELPAQDLIIFSMRGVPVIDTSGGQALHDLCSKYQKQGATIMFSGVQPKVMEMFKIDGIMELVQEDNFFWDTEKAIIAFEKSLA